MEQDAHRPIKESPFPTKCNSVLTQLSKDGSSLSPISMKNCNKMMYLTHSPNLDRSKVYISTSIEGQDMSKDTLWLSTPHMKKHQKQSRTWMVMKFRKNMSVLTGLFRINLLDKAKEIGEWFQSFNDNNSWEGSNNQSFSSSSSSSLGGRWYNLREMGV